MSIYLIHPIVLGTKEFDKGMMTYQHDYGRPFTIPPGPYANTKHKPKSAEEYSCHES